MKKETVRVELYRNGDSEFLSFRAKISMANAAQIIKLISQIPYIPLKPKEKPPNK